MLNCCLFFVLFGFGVVVGLVIVCEIVMEFVVVLVISCMLLRLLMVGFEFLVIDDIMVWMWCDVFVWEYL